MQNFSEIELNRCEMGVCASATAIRSHVVYVDNMINLHMW